MGSLIAWAEGDHCEEHNQTGHSRDRPAGSGWHPDWGAKGV